MCGIAGILKLKPSAPFMASSLKKMAGTLKHRGPDDEGYVCFGTSGVALFGGDDTQEASWNIDLPYAAKHNINNCETDFYLGLAHRRLSIIDLSAAGHQPMCNADGTIWLTCNGEIYNYWEIREELEEKSVKFVSGCDVEVLLKAYEYWGMDFLKKLNGMWSFVIYDMRSNLLIGCRDRFGVKPFYYYRSEKMLVFASEQKAITVLPVETSLNPEAVFDYLVNSKVEFKEEGFYKNIKELMPSHYFIYDLNTNHFDITKYYSLNFNNSSEKFDSARFPEIVLQSNEKITSAISLRLRSDVNVGFCLSGGIDSSSIIGVSQKINAQNPLKQLNGNLHAFTAACGDKSCDETGWAEQVVRKNALKWDKYTCSSENLFTELENIIYYQDSPLYSTSTYAQSSVMKLAKEHGMTILLDGQAVTNCSAVMYLSLFPIILSY